MASSNQEEQEVEVSLASSVDEALLAGIVSKERPLPLDQRELDGDAGWGLRCIVGDLLEWASFFRRFSFALRFWKTIPESEKPYLEVKDHTWNHTYNGNARYFDSWLFYHLLILTWTTRMSSPVSWLSCSRMCLAGLGELLYAIFNVSSCFAVIVVRGRFEDDSTREWVSNCERFYWRNHHPFKTLTSLFGRFVIGLAY